MILMKKCTSCNIEKDLSEFAPQKLGKYGVTSKCRPCRAAQVSEWAKNNREKCAEKLRRWRAKNKQRSRDCNRAYYKANRQKRIRSVIEWQKRNPESKLVCNSVYRARNQEKLKEWRRRNRGAVAEMSRERESTKSMATPKWLSKEHKLCMKSFYELSNRVGLCIGVKHNVDHVMPLKSSILCGLHVPWNLQVLPARINAKKKNKIEGSCY